MAAALSKSQTIRCKSLQQRSTGSIICSLWIGLIWQLGCFSALAAQAQIEKLTLSHPNIEQPLVFNVTLPNSYSKGDKRYFVLFDFHHMAQAHLAGMHFWLSHNGQVPWLETIIVTPEPGNRVGMLHDKTGKSIALIDFFADQLFPAIDKQYRTNDFRIMSGFRVNGTLVLSALLNRAEMLNAYIAVSPELKDDHANILSTAADKLRKLNDKPRFLYFSHGQSVKEAHQQQDYAKLLNALQSTAPPSLEWHYQDYADNYFMSLPLLSTIQSIELLFNDIHVGVKPDSKIAKDGVDSIVKHYQYLSEKKYGFEVSPKRSINNLGMYWLDTQPEKGIAILKQNLQRYPDDAYSYHNLAKGYAELGDYKQAVKVQRQAVEQSKDMKTWHKRYLKKALDEYRKNAKNSAK